MQLLIRFAEIYGNSEILNPVDRRSWELIARRLTPTSRVIELLSGKGAFEGEVYDLGVCLGSLYLFRQAGWRALMKGARKQGYWNPRGPSRECGTPMAFRPTFGYTAHGENGR